MNDRLDGLRREELPKLPPDFQTQVEAWVRPIMKRRRVVRRVTVSTHLTNKDVMTRNVAHSCLKGILGTEIEWESMALAGMQPEAVRRLRAEVEAFIAADTIPSH
ncbi:MAG TPA: hypothetical protein QF901_08795 [Gammaproteobacteria bacterium]|jgi:hypothetical protein|nr:hypothetical protein [Gammaproteobacteria bacterium]|tara:strand:- start:33 stop:347 length:315 start_codon:yes stop_codon:yes gene_type:complete